MSDRERQSERDRERVARLRAQEEASGDPALMDQPYLPEAAFVPDSGLVETPEEFRRPAADTPRGERPPRPERYVDRGPRPDRMPDRNAEVTPEASAQSEPGPRPPRPERAPRQSPVAALLAEVEQPKADTVAAPGADAAPRPVRARKPKPKPEPVSDGPAEAAE